MVCAWITVCSVVLAPGEAPPQVTPPGDAASPELTASTRVSGSIESSLSRVVGKAGPALAAQVARLLRWRGDIVRDVHPGDKLTILYRNDSEPELVAVSYQGAAIQLEGFLATDKSGIARYYDSEGALIEPSLVQSPVPGYHQITETVQKGRGKRRHHGLDLKAPEGTPVLTPYEARVSRVNWSTRRNGLCVEVVYTEGPARGAYARFLHLSRVDDQVKPGTRLAAGTLLGEVGSTGRSSAPHLHYEIRGKAGEVIDPLRIHSGAHAGLTQHRRQKFQQQVAQWRNQLNGGRHVSSFN